MLWKQVCDWSGGLRESLERLWVGTLSAGWVGGWVAAGGGGEVVKAFIHFPVIS